MDVSPGKESHPTLKHCLGQQVCRVSTAQPLGSSTTDGLSPFSKQERERERNNERERKKERKTWRVRGVERPCSAPRIRKRRASKGQGSQTKKVPLQIQVTWTQTPLPVPDSSRGVAAPCNRTDTRTRERGSCARCREGNLSNPKLKEQSEYCATMTSPGIQPDSLKVPWTNLRVEGPL